MAADDERTVEVDGREVRVSRPEQGVLPRVGRHQVRPRVVLPRDRRAPPQHRRRAPRHAAALPRRRQRQVLLPEAHPERRPRLAAVDGRVDAQRHHVQRVSWWPTSRTWCGPSNIGCLGLHLWPYLAADPEHADELRIDLDPTTGIGFDEVRAGRAALPRPAGRARAAGVPEDDGQRRPARVLQLEPRWDSVEVRARRWHWPAGSSGATPSRSRPTGGRRRRAAAASSWTSTRTRRARRCSARGSPGPARAARCRPRSRGKRSRRSVSDELTIFTVPELVRRRGDPWADVAANRASIEPLLALAERDKAAGLHDARGHRSTRRCPTSRPGSRPSRGQEGLRRAVDALEALQRSRPYLERGGADTYKVRAFRNAAKALDRVPRRTGSRRWRRRDASRASPASAARRPR